MKICIIILTDGRNDYLSKTLESLEKNVIFPAYAEVYKIMVDDCPADRDEKAIRKIAKKYKVDKVVLNSENLGINKNVQKAWSLIPEDVDYIWHQENDFLFLEEVLVGDFISILNSNIIVQVALLRQPWYDDEIKAGSLIKTRRERFRPGFAAGFDVVLHRDFFTHNPCLYKRCFIRMMDNYSEYSFKNLMLSENSSRMFAFYGKMNDGHRVLHIGETKINHAEVLR